MEVNVEEHTGNDVILQRQSFANNKELREQTNLLFEEDIFNVDETKLNRNVKKTVDGPWSIVVGLSSFIAQSFLGGYVYTGGMFYTLFIREFPQTSTVAISWLCTLPLTLWFVGSPVGSILTNKFGCRISALIGSLMASVGLCLCYFATSFYMVFLFYGVLAGIGNGIIYVGFVTSVSRYFHKYRSTVTILTTIGPTFGMAVYSFIVPSLIEIYGWKGSFLILGGTSFNLCACACALYPSNEHRISKNQSFDISLFKNKYFVFFSFQCGFANFTNSMVLLHLPSLILSFNFMVTLSSLSLTLYGVSNCIAKVIYGTLGHLCQIDVTNVFTLSLCACGISMAMVPSTSNVEWVLSFVALVGFTFNVTGGHSLEVILELVGEDCFSDGVGISQLFKAVGTLLAGPIAGILYQTTGNYEVTFYVSGVCMATSTVLMVPAVVSKFRNTRKNTRNIQINNVAVNN